MESVSDVKKWEDFPNVRSRILFETQVVCAQIVVSSIAWIRYRVVDTAISRYCSTGYQTGFGREGLRLRQLNLNVCRSHNTRILFSIIAYGPCWSSTSGRADRLNLRFRITFFLFSSLVRLLGNHLSNTRMFSHSNLTLLLRLALLVTH